MILHAVSIQPGIFTMRKTLRTNLAATTVFIGCIFAGSAAAQSKIQCQVTESGDVVAPLVWQNTLGAERANSICQQTAANQSRLAARPVEKTDHRHDVAPTVYRTQAHNSNVPAGYSPIAPADPIFPVAALQGYSKIW